MTQAIPPFLLNQLAVVERSLGRTADGPLYDVGVGVRCRVEITTARSRDRSREAQTLRGRMFAAASAPIASGDRVTLDGRSWVVSSVHEQYGLVGPSHIEASLDPV